MNLKHNLTANSGGTQDTVLGWVWDTVVRADVEASITDQINAELNPTSTAGLPW